MPFESKLFRVWLLLACLMWLFLFGRYSDIGFLMDNWIYPVIMIVGAFVAGVTPEGGGVVAFPVLNIFIGIERPVARDFSLMIQSVGMTSASLFILTSAGTNLRTFVPVLWMLPSGIVGFILGMQFLQAIPVPMIQALFLSLIATFTVVYYLSAHRGEHAELLTLGKSDWTVIVVVCLFGGMCASLFGTGADIFIYTLLVTRFRMLEKTATQISIMLMAGISLAGFAWRHVVEGELTSHQVQTWLAAYPVVLFMAPLGAYVLKRVNKEILLGFICVLNIGQLLYFNLYNPAPTKWIWSIVFTSVLSLAFYYVMRGLVNIDRRPARGGASQAV
jgi:uncharacterized membrane protein YfcA